MDFGVPSKKRVKQEKYPNTAVVTLYPYEGAKTSRKIEFNKKAYEVMGLKQDEYNQVAFSFNPSNIADNSVINANELSIGASLKVAKNGIVSNKAHFEEIKSRFQVEIKDELELKLVDSGKEFNGFKVFSLVVLSEEEDTQEQEEDARPEEDQVGMLLNPGDEQAIAAEQPLTEADATEELEEEDSVFSSPKNDVAQAPVQPVVNDIVEDEDEDDDLPF